VTTFTAAVKAQNEQAVLETLRALTWPGELLLGVTLCRLNPGGLLDGVYYAGLTPRRFLLVRKDRPARVYSIYRICVEQARYAQAGGLGRQGLELRLGGESILLETTPAWERAAREMAEKHAAWEAESPYLTSDQFLASITDLADLGLARPAQALLREHMTSNPVIEIEPQAAELDRHISETRQSLGLSAGMMVLALLYMLGQVIFGSTWNGPAILLSMAAIVELLRWKQARRALALILALTAAVFNLGYGALGGSLLNGVLWVSFSAAVTLALTGRASRARNLAAGAVFALGFLAPLVLVGVSLAAPVRTQFSDDFSSHSGWVTCQGCGQGAASSQIEDGAYAVHVKEAGTAFFAFPPVHFVPSETDFEVKIPAEYRKEVGTFGVTCGYQDTDSQYMVELDPRGQSYAFLRQQGEQITSLTRSYWNPLTGTSLGDTVHLRVSCANNQISLAVNGVKQGQVSAPSLDGRGKMGLFVRTWPETGPLGYKVLFDNETFKQTDVQ
jgi:hypothetical protein